MSKRERFLRGLRWVPVVIAFAAIFGWIVMALWNWLVPPVIGWKAIDYWQALGLLLLSRIFFGFGRFGGHGHGHHHWRARMVERWEQMTPEEREKFREGMRGHRC